MINFILQIICSFLIAMSFIFIVVEMRAKVHKRFLIFGVSNLLLCSFCAIDIWILYNNPTHLIWTKLQHIVILVFLPFFTWHHLILVHRENFKIIKALFFVTMLFSIAFFSDWMMTLENDKIVSTMLYSATFAPYLIIVCISNIWLLLFNLRRLSQEERKILYFHFFGTFILFTCGMLDLVCILLNNPFFIPFASMSVIGTLSYSLIITSVFIEILSTLIRNREITFFKLRAAYKELEEVQSLKELGQSTAIINHEIKNYTCGIFGYADLILRTVVLDDTAKNLVDRIISSCNKITSFSQDILDFSKSRILLDKAPINMTNCINNCIQTSFSLKKHCFVFEHGFSSDIFINADWGKLEQVFINIFKNALEAEATRISLRTIMKKSVRLLIIEDNGIGCNEEQLENLFKAFYTTKQNKQGTGLGMCIVRSIIESHGGHISAYSKNLINDNNHGLILNISFPLYDDTGDTETEKKDNVVFIKEDIKDLVKVIKIFQNISLNPHILQSVKDLDEKSIINDSTLIIASPKSVQHLLQKSGFCCKTHTLVDSRQGLMVIDDINNPTLQIFSEAYILANFQKNNPEKTDSRHPHSLPQISPADSIIGS